MESNTEGNEPVKAKSRIRVTHVQEREHQWIPENARRQPSHLRPTDLNTIDFFSFSLLVRGTLLQQPRNRTHTALIKVNLSLLTAHRGRKNKSVEGWRSQTEERSGCGCLAATSKLQASNTVGPEPRAEEEFPEVKKGVGLPRTSALDQSLHQPWQALTSPESEDFLCRVSLAFLRCRTHFWCLYHLRYATQSYSVSSLKAGSFGFMFC